MKLKSSALLKAFQPPVLIDMHFEENITKSFAEQTNEASITAKATVNPELLSLIEKAGFVRRGSKRHIYAMSTNDGGDIALRRFVKKYAETFQPMTLIDSDIDAETVAHNESRYLNFPQPTLDIFPLQSPVRQFYNFRNQEEAARRAFKMTDEQFQVATRWDGKIAAPFFVVLEHKHRESMTWLRIVRNVHIDFDLREESAWKYVNTSEIAGETIKHIDSFSFFEYDEFENAIKNAELSREHFTENSSAFFDIAERIEEKVLVSYKAAHPAVGVIRVGNEIKTGIGRIPARYKKIPSGILREIEIVEALNLATKHKKVDFLFHPSLKDISDMTKATMFNDARLREYQKQAVGLHISTEVGYLNACSPGLGKTVMQLSAMRERAKTKPNYRGLILAEMNVLEQWSEEMNIWFPEAIKIITDNNHNLEEIVATLSETEPAVILMPYTHLNHVWREMVRIEETENALKSKRTLKQKLAFLNSLETETTLGSLILNSKWDDIAADEAMVIRNNNSKQAKAAWKIRENSNVAVALTGTPINNNVQDIANLISWTRNDRNLFRGVNFEEKYDLAKPSQAKKLFATFGPLVFRRDTTEIKEELPTTESPAIQLLEATPGERALIDTAENELRRCYEELLEALNNVEINKQNEEELATLKEELKDARKAWLGGQTLARMATSDPATVGNSQSVGATLLIGQGLVEAALTKVPTKRERLVKELSKRVSNQEQSLVFVEFEATARVLQETLTANGIKAEVFTGKNRNVRDQHRIAFQNGELDVLVITQAGERGLTLHRASAVYCYDLPWSLEKVLQRIGRAVRIGSQNEKVDIIFMVMKDTIEERIANKLVKMAVSSANLLDATRGVQVKNTEIMNSLGGLITSINGRSNKTSLKSFGDNFLAA